MILTKRQGIKILFFIWIFFWIFFNFRELFLKDKLFFYYFRLLKDSYTERYEDVYGRDYYDFLSFTEKNIPNGSTFSLAGVEKYSLNHRRAVYYLYPLLESADAEFLVVYQKAGYNKEGYRLFRTFEDESCILKKVY